MLSLECIGLTSAYLQIKEGSKIGNLLLNGSQSHHAIEFRQTFGVVNSLGSLIRNILLHDGHQLLIGLRRHILFLQTFCLLSRNLIEQLPHRPAIGEVFVTRVVHFRNHLTGQFLRFWCEDILLRLGEYLHNLIQLVRIIVFDIQEIAEAAANTGIDTEQVLHLRTVTSSNHHEFTTVILHAFHQLL